VTRHRIGKGRRSVVKGRLTKAQLAQRLLEGANALFDARSDMRQDSDMLQNAYDDASGVTHLDVYANPLVKETKDKLYQLDHQIGDAARQMEHLARELKK
jgi:hypothetical protein